MRANEFTNIEEGLKQNLAAAGLGTALALGGGQMTNQAQAADLGDKTQATQQQNTADRVTVPNQAEEGQLVKKFAQQMGLDRIRNYESLSRIPIYINGQPVPQNLYTNDQKLLIQGTLQYRELTGAQDGNEQTGGNFDSRY